MLRMGNRQFGAQTDGCCVTLETSESTPPPPPCDNGSDEPVPQVLLEVPEPTLTPARNSFEIMSRFNWVGRSLYLFIL